MANFTSVGRLKDLPDPQKQYLWELYIPDIEELSMEDMVLRARTVSIPGRSTEAIESVFMGSRQFYAGRTTPGEGTLETTFDEFEDGKVKTQITSWQQAIFNIDPDASKAGQSAFLKKSDYARDITLKMYKSNGDVMKEIVIYGCWPQAIDAPGLDYAGTEKVQYSVTWQFDYWLEK